MIKAKCILYDHIITVMYNFFIFFLSGQNCKLRFVFVTQAKIPAFKDNHNDISVATGIPLSVKDGVSQDTYNLLHDYRSECVAEKVYEIHPHGGINIIDKNIKQSFFEIQNTYTAFTKIHNLKVRDSLFMFFQTISVST